MNVSEGYSLHSRNCSHSTRAVWASSLIVTKSTPTSLTVTRATELNKCNIPRAVVVNLRSHSSRKLYHSRPWYIIHINCFMRLNCNKRSVSYNQRTRTRTVGLVNYVRCVYRINRRQSRSGGSTVRGATNKVHRRCLYWQNLATIDLPWRNYLKSKVWNKIAREVYLIFRVTRISLKLSRMDRRKPPRQKSAQSIEPF